MRTICLILAAAVVSGFAVPYSGVPAPVRAPREPVVHWRDSRPLGAPAAGRLLRGVRLPAGGRDFFT